MPTKAKQPAKPRQLQKRGDGTAMMRVKGKTVDLLNDPATVSEWDEEELRRGQRKDKNGRFTGRPPRVVPMECYRELNRRQLRTAQGLLSDNLEAAVQALADVATSPMAEDRDRIMAAKIIMERVMGRAPEQINIDIRTPKWMEALKGGIVPGEDEDFIETTATDIT